MNMNSPAPWLLLTAACVVAAAAIVVYALHTLDAPISEPCPIDYDGAWLTPEQLDDADRRMMIAEARAREDARVARLDAIPVPGDWDVPQAWHDLFKAQG